MILDRILEQKKTEVADRRTALPIDEIKKMAADASDTRDFSAALVPGLSGLPAVIAEVKKASPSKGIIRADFEPVSIARSYESAGAAAISVLTDEQFFKGSLDYLRAVRSAVSVPVLRKDFLIDDYQVYEARAAGADALLLIVAALEKNELWDLMGLADELGMTTLVEVHNESEMEVALEIGASLLGINNRNLYTFEVSLDTTAQLLQSMESTQRSCPRIVSESGIFTRNDMEKLAALGVDAVLIGEALMREGDVETKLRELIG